MKKNTSTQITIGQGSGRKVISVTGGKNGKQKKRDGSKRNGNPGNVAGLPVSFGVSYGGSRPSVRGSGEGIVISHREYVTNVALSTVSDALKSMLTFNLNPGNPVLFPWLANISRNFASYRFERMDFIYEPSAPTSVGGFVLLAHDPDPTNLLPSSRQALGDFRRTSRFAPFEGGLLRVPSPELNTLGPRKMVRTDSLTSREMSATFDSGMVHVFAVGPESYALAGELHVAYTVRLMSPQSVDPPVTCIQMHIPNVIFNAADFMPFGPSDQSYVSSKVGALNVNWVNNVGSTTLRMSSPGCFQITLRFRVDEDIVVGDLPTLSGSIGTSGDRLPVHWDPSTTVPRLYSISGLLINHDVSPTLTLTSASANLYGGVCDMYVSFSPLNL